MEKFVCHPGHRKVSERLARKLNEKYFCELSNFEWKRKQYGKKAVFDVSKWIYLCVEAHTNKLYSHSESTSQLIFNSLYVERTYIVPAYIMYISDFLTSLTCVKWQLRA